MNEITSEKNTSAVYSPFPPSIGIALFAAIAAVAQIVPQSGGIVFGVCVALCILGQALNSRQILPTGDVPMALIIASCLTAYCVIGLLWAPDFGLAVSKVPLPIAIIVGSFVIAQWITDARPQAVNVLAYATVIGFALSAIFILSQQLDGMAIITQLYNYFPSIRPNSDKYLYLANDTVVGVQTTFLHKAIATTALGLWPTLWIINLIVKNVLVRSALQFALTIIVLIIAFISEHESTKLALVVSLAILALSYWNLTIIFRLLCIGWILAFLLVVPLSILADKSGLTTADWIQQTGRARLIIWSTTANKTLDAPLLGAGIQAVKSVHNANGLPKAKDGDAYPRGYLGPHTHNIFLQIWYELGFIGVLLVAGLGLTVLRQVPKRSEEFQRFAYPAILTIMTFAALGWGLWASWLYYSWALLAAILLVADRLHQNQQAEEAKPAAASLASDETP